MSAGNKEPREPQVADKFMRVLLMFDVPTKTKKEQKHATKFRNNLIKLGYFMMQFSVYMRICKGISSAKASINAVKMILPPYGNVRVLLITEKQFDAMEILLGSPSFNEDINAQHNLVLFNFDEKLGDYAYKESSQDHAKESPTSSSNGEKSNIQSTMKDKTKEESDPVPSSTQAKKPSKPKQLHLFEF